jgi:hypothetical protein
MTENEIAKQILDAAFVVHTKFAPGLFESVYEGRDAVRSDEERISLRNVRSPCRYCTITFDLIRRSGPTWW